MKISLIYPPMSLSERYVVSYKSVMGRSCPLGIYYIAAAARQANHQVQVIEAEGQNLTTDETIREVEKFSPDIVGISSTTMAFHRAVELADKLRNFSPPPPPPTTLNLSYQYPRIILGGYHVSSNTQDALSGGNFDIGIIGEGEKTLVELLNCIENKGDYKQIDGIAFMQNGSFVKTKPRALIENLDEIPFPAYDLIEDMSIYYPQVHNYKNDNCWSIITSRGCPNQCTFCDRSVFKSTLRQRSPENVASEIALLYHKYKRREFFFADDTFTINFDRVIKLFDILRAQNISISWTCTSRVNAVSHEIIRAMKKLGCWKVFFGIESGDPDILKLIKKNIDLSQAHQVLQMCRKEGLLAGGFFMIGHPGETLETIEASIKAGLDLPLSDVSVFVNTPYPGSEQYNQVDKYGTLASTDWTQYSNFRPVFIPHGLTQEILLQKQREFTKRFYLRPKIIFSFFLQFLSFNGIKRAMRVMQALPYFLFGK